MGSPRKATHSRDKQENRKASRSHPPQVFARKKFFLDLRPRASNSGIVKQLVEEIKILGGTLEDFFSKEVSHVISDAPESKLKVVTKPEEVSALNSDVSGLAVCSPPAADLHFAVPSPVDDSIKETLMRRNGFCNGTAEEAKKSSVRTRVDTILERARHKSQQSKPGSGSAACGADVLENAHRWGLKVWSLTKFIAWIKSFKTQFGPLVRVSKNKSKDSLRPSHGHNLRNRLPGEGGAANGVGGEAGGDEEDPADCQKQELRSPFIKFEVDNCLYKPVFLEFRRFPKLYLTGRAGTSPFYPPEASKSRHLKFPDQPHNVNNHQINNATRNGIKSPKSKRDAAAAPNGEARNDEAKRPAAHQAAHRPRAQPVQGTGFCEICDATFTDLHVHLVSGRHRSAVANDNYWTRLDECIGMVNAGAAVDGSEEYLAPIAKDCSRSWRK